MISCVNNQNESTKNSFLKTNQKDNFVGNWIGCGYNNGQEINIELIDENYVIKNKKYNSEWVFTKISPTLIQALNGLISFRYESKTGYLKLIDGGPTEEFKKIDK